MLAKVTVAKKNRMTPVEVLLDLSTKLCRASIGHDGVIDVGVARAAAEIAEMPAPYVQPQIGIAQPEDARISVIAQAAQAKVFIPDNGRRLVALPHEPNAPICVEPAKRKHDGDVFPGNRSPRP